MEETIVVDVIETVAEVQGVDPTDLDYALQDYVDTEALRMLAAHDGGAWTLTFELPDYDVTVTGDGLILVDGTREAIWA